MLLVKYIPIFPYSDFMQPHRTISSGFYITIFYYIFGNIRLLAKYIPIFPYSNFVQPHQTISSGLYVTIFYYIFGNFMLLVKYIPIFPYSDFMQPYQNCPFTNPRIAVVVVKQRSPFQRRPA